MPTTDSQTSPPTSRCLDYQCPAVMTVPSPIQPTIYNLQQNKLSFVITLLSHLYSLHCLQLSIYSPNTKRIWGSTFLSGPATLSLFFSISLSSLLLFLISLSLNVFSIHFLYLIVFIYLSIHSQFIRILINQCSCIFNSPRWLMSLSPTHRHWYFCLLM